MGLFQSRALISLAAVLVCASHVAQADSRRIAVVVGNNAGSESMPPLRFAETDAGKMARVLVELGEVSADDLLLLQGLGVSAVERALSDVRERIVQYRATPDLRTVLIFYFSGHSDGEAIELGREKLHYQRLKAMLAGTGADLRLVIVDACRSGQGLKEKGAKAVEPFAIRMTDQLQASGDAFISSSAANEAALESSEVMGSYFTHNLVSGLRGAADISGDRLVTLSEAYRYAYDRTVASTSTLGAGAQHPSYDFKLSGQGELVLSMLVRPDALMVLPSDAERTIVTDVVRDQVVAEVPRSANREIALPAGQYGIRTFRGTQSFAGRVAIASGGKRVVQWADLTAVSASVVATAKGATEVSQSIDLATAQRNVVALWLAGGATGKILTNPAGGDGLKMQLRLGVEPLRTEFVRFGASGFERAALRGVLGVQLVGEASFDAPAAVGQEAVNEAGGHLNVGYRVELNWLRLTFGIGAQLGVGFLSQLYGKRGTTTLFVASPGALLRFRLFGPLALTANLDFPFTALRVADDTGERLGWYSFVAAGAGIAVEL